MSSDPPSEGIFRAVFATINLNGRHERYWRHRRKAELHRSHSFHTRLSVYLSFHSSRGAAEVGRPARTSNSTQPQLLSKTFLAIKSALPHTAQHAARGDKCPTQTVPDS